MLWEIALEFSELTSVRLCSVFFVIWVYNYLTCGVCKSKTSLDGKTVIVTGSNSGIGKITALDLARRGARVIMACRDMQKANAVRDHIVETTKNTNVVIKKLDLTSFKSVREFADDILKTESRLDVLIHNAANLQSGEATEDGLNPIWACNYYGPFLLTHLLIDLLRNTKKSRIVFVSSALHWFGMVDLRNPNPVGDRAQWKNYSHSKFAGVLFANELARRLEGTGVTANSLHPGVIYTPIWNSTFWIYVVSLLKFFLKNEEQGAQTTIYAAVSSKVEGATGKYYQDCHEWISNPKTKDSRLAKMFWAISEELVKLKDTDPHIM